MYPGGRENFWGVDSEVEVVGRRCGEKSSEDDMTAVNAGREGSLRALVDCGPATGADSAATLTSPRAYIGIIPSQSEVGWI